MAHSTITVDATDAEQLAQVFAVAARLGVKFRSGRIGPHRLQLELEESAPVAEFAREVQCLGLRASVAPGAHLAEGLSPREREVVAHLAGGLQLKEVAQKMGVQVHTVREYWLRVKRKWNVKTVAQAASLWTEHGDHEH